MKNFKNLFGTLAVLLAGTGVANAAATGPVTASLSLHGTIVSDTCTFSFPTTAPALNVDAATYSSAEVGGTIGTGVDLGQITALGCNAKTVTLKAQSDAQITGNAERGKFTYTNKPADAKDPLAFLISYAVAGLDQPPEGPIKGNLKLDNTSPVSVNGSSSSFTIPLSLSVLKQEAVDNIGAYAGDFTATVTYTADFS